MPSVPSKLLITILIIIPNIFVKSPPIVKIIVDFKKVDFLIVKYMRKKMVSVLYNWLTSSKKNKVEKRCKFLTRNGANDKINSRIGERVMKRKLNYVLLFLLAIVLLPLGVKAEGTFSITAEAEMKIG